MCLLVFAGDYLCGHKVLPNHGIPKEFVRDCEHSANLRDCQLSPSEEAVPWLCPNCHWDYIKQNLAPLWQQTTIAKCRVLQQAEMFPAEPTYAPAQKAADRLSATFDTQQQAINLTSVAYHELRDRTLKSFLGQNFGSCLMRAHEAHRPWTGSYTRDPFVRIRSDVDDESDPDADVEVNPYSSIIDLFRSLSNEPARVASPGLEMPSRPGGVIVQSDGELYTSHDLSSPASGSGRETEEVESHNRQCQWCQTRGSQAGITADRSVCFACRARGVTDLVDLAQNIRVTTRELDDENDEDPADEAVEYNAPSHSQIPAEPPDVSSLSLGEPNALQPAVRGHPQTRGDPTDIMMLSLGSPSAIVSRLRGHPNGVVAARRERAAAMEQEARELDFWTEELLSLEESPEGWTRAPPISDQELLPSKKRPQHCLAPYLSPIPTTIQITLRRGDDDV